MNSPEIISALRNGLLLWKKLYEQPAKRVNNQVAVVLNTPEMYLHGFPVVEKQSLPITLLITEALHSLHRSGHSFDLLDLRGFLESKKQYKAVVFLNMFTVDEKVCLALQKKLHRKGVTAIWQYAPGLVTAKKWSVENSSSLTGGQLFHQRSAFYRQHNGYEDGLFFHLGVCAADPLRWRLSKLST